ncbi:MAG TPA: hypothetical protein V6C89_17005 [Drouetiella sp.]|jgi:hypothetical protein
MFATSARSLKNLLIEKLPEATVLLFVCMFSLAQSASAQDQRLAKIRQDYFGGAFERVLADYPLLPGDVRNSAPALFFVGQSYLRMHDIEHAEDYLKKAQSVGLAKQQQQRAEAALERIATLKQLRPPFFRDYALDNFKIRVFAKDTPWSRNLTKQIPAFLARAKEGFGNDNAFVSFYLFEDHPSYDRFFDSWTVDPQNILHRGTGGMQIVMYCRYYPTGKEVGANDINDLYFRVLHEYSHALCHTTYGDQFRMPQWLNEGMADYFGWKYKPDGSAQAREKLRRIAAQKPARTYEDLSTRLHDDNELGYVIGDVMVTELFSGQPLSIYGRLIDTARADGGNFDSAVKKVTGKDPRAVYAQLLRAYWKAN